MIPSARLIRNRKSANLHSGHLFMIIERHIVIDKLKYTVVLSDNTDSLQAAYQAGKAVVGIWDSSRLEHSLFPAQYVVESLDDADDAFLEKVIRRRFHLPLIIASTERLVIREFTLEDLPVIPLEEEAGEDDKIFQSQETLYAYIQNQYCFYEYGIWAVVRKEDGALIGKAGVTPAEPADWKSDGQTVYHLSETACSVSESPIENFSDLPPVELGYHIFRPFRRQGYALEACKAVIGYCREEISPNLFLRINKKNLPSQKTAEKSGFKPVF